MNFVSYRDDLALNLFEAAVEALIFSLIEVRNLKVRHFTQIDGQCWLVLPT